LRLGALCELHHCYLNHRHDQRPLARARIPSRVETTSSKQASSRDEGPTRSFCRLRAVPMQPPYVRAHERLPRWWSCSILSELSLEAPLLGCTLWRVRGSPYGAIAGRNLSVACVTWRPRSHPHDAARVNIYLRPELMDGELLTKMTQCRTVRCSVLVARHSHSQRSRDGD
jgi:hypothetical protein